MRWTSNRRAAGPWRSKVRGYAQAVALAGACLPAAGMADAVYEEAGRAGAPASWRSPEFARSWGLAAIGADFAYARGLSGSGIGMGVIDSGVADWHSELAGTTHRVPTHDAGCESRERIAGPAACFFSDGGVTYNYVDDYTVSQRAAINHMTRRQQLSRSAQRTLLAYPGMHYDTHGTHVAGVMAAHRDGVGMHGVAYNAQLYSANKESDSYSNSDQRLGKRDGVLHVRAPQFPTRQQMYKRMAAHKVRIINNAWSTLASPRDATTMDAQARDKNNAMLLRLYADTAVRDDLVQVFAAGNFDGRIASVYAHLPRYYPEAESRWLSVVSLQPNLRLSAKSSTCALSQDWCIAAPGGQIYSSIPEGEVTGEVVHDAAGIVTGVHATPRTAISGYAELSGTSMASPHVSGGMALLMERFPYLSSGQVREVLLTTARDLGRKGVDSTYGWGLMDLRKAIDGPALLRADMQVVMDQPAGGSHVWEGPAWDQWGNDISGPGWLIKSGAGWLRLSGRNRFAGTRVLQGVLELDGDHSLAGGVEVDGGQLRLVGSVSHTNIAIRHGQAEVSGRMQQGLLQVGVQGRLSGNGTVSHADVAGVIAPGGAATGDLQVEGDYSQHAGSLYEADVAASGSADCIRVRGTAHLHGGNVRVQIDGAAPGQRFLLLEAARVQGRFAGVELATPSPSSSLVVSYTPTQVWVTLSAHAGDARTARQE